MIEFSLETNKDSEWEKTSQNNNVDNENNLENNISEPPAKPEIQRVIVDLAKLNNPQEIDKIYESLEKYYDKIVDSEVFLKVHQKLNMVKPKDYLVF